MMNDILSIIVIHNKMFICEALYILYLIHFYTNMYVIVERNLY